MKFAIDIGHNSPPDTGAVGIEREDKLNLELGKKIISRLQSLGHEAVNVTPKIGDCKTVNESLAQRCLSANLARVDRFVSLHFNAFNGKAYGSEVFYVSKAGLAMAQPVQDELVRLGFRDRGAKFSRYLKVLNGTNAPAILIEVCFCDSERDMNLYKKIGTDNIANAITFGLTGEYPNTDSSENNEYCG